MPTTTSACPCSSPLCALCPPFRSAAARSSSATHPWAHGVLAGAAHATQLGPGGGLVARAAGQAPGAPSSEWQGDTRHCCGTARGCPSGAGHARRALATCLLPTPLAPSPTCVRAAGFLDSSCHPAGTYTRSQPTTRQRQEGGQLDSRAPTERPLGTRG